METTPQTLPALLRAYRTKHRLSAELLGDRLGVTRQTVSRWECQTTRPGVEHLPALAELLGVDVGELMKMTAKETA